MDKRGFINLEVINGDNRFMFSMPIGCPLQDAYDASQEFTNEIVAIAESNKKRQEQEAKDKEEKDKE